MPKINAISLISIKRMHGFTLIEVIVGMVMLAISLSIVTSFIAPTEQHSADQIHQVKAAELAQSLMNDITGKAFDNNSDMAGGRERCNEAGQPACTAAVSFGPDAGETQRSLYNDVDDFHGFSDLVSSTDDDLHTGYNSFQIDVLVFYGGTDLGLALGAAKRIEINVTTPLGTDIALTSYRSNF